MKSWILCAVGLLMVMNAHALDAEDNGKWISVGAPRSFHQGTEGALYLNGDAHGACSGVTPTYIRMDMAQPYFKEFYSLWLYMAAQKKPLDCVVASGCGSNEVWVKYCRGKF